MRVPYLPFAIAVAIVLPSALTSQVAIPGPGVFEKLEAGSYGRWLGAYATQRVQLVNGDLAGDKTKYSWSSLSLRRESGIGWTNTARSWKNVSISIAPHDWSVTSRWFSRNLFSTPTRVFSAAMSWPGTRDLPPRLQPAWGEFASKNDMKWGFKTPYLRKDTLGVAVDFMFTGGTLANNAAWTGRSSYYTDGVMGPSPVSNGGRTVLIGRRNCYAAGQNNFNYFVPFASTFASTAPANASSIQLHFRAIRMPASSNAFGVIATDGGPWTGTGTAFNGSCVNLHLNLNKPWIPWTFKTTATGSYTSAAKPLTAKFQAAFVGVRLWTQAAFSEKGVDQLTRAGRCVIRNMPATTKGALLFQQGQFVNLQIGLRFTENVNCIRLDK